MKTQNMITRLEKKGYKVQYMTGQLNGNMTTVGVVATKDNRRYEDTSIIKIYNRLK